MKTKMNTLRKIIIFIFIYSTNFLSHAQSKSSIAVLGIDTKGVTYDAASMGALVRLELEKTGIYEVLDPYDVEDIINNNNVDIENCYGKSCQIRVGSLLKSDKMLTGSVHRFGEKIVITLRLIDIGKDIIEKSEVMEFVNQQPDMQSMVTITINNLLEIENDANLVEMLAKYEQPITSDKTKVKLNGPRMGVTWTSGDIGRRLMESRENGGYNMYPLTFMFGYQYEVQYLSAGEFQALFEFLGTINGLESGTVVPALTIMNGFRFNKTGIEIGFGPSFRIIKTAKGYYDEDDTWHLENELPSGASYPIIETIDNRGKAKISTSLIFAIGKTFRSGYLNMPVNLYVSPRKEGTIVGLTFGFNIARRNKL